MFNKVCASPRVVNSNVFLVSIRLGLVFSFICTVHHANSSPFLHVIMVFPFHELLDFRELACNNLCLSLVTS